MDSNNFPGAVGVGEREARVACPLVSRRHFRLAHGVGRSGDIAAEQPKAAGSSLLAKLGAALAGDALRLAGLEGMAPPAVLPLATGMALTATLLAAAARRGPQARYVVWSRIDQKTCLKAITAANLAPVVIELRRDGDQLVTDLDAIAAALARLGPRAVAAVVTTTSCFAPRASDDVVGAAKLCAAAGVPHVVNHAYGVQARALCAAVAAAARRGRVDAVVSSTDKNFMVPVGGALVMSPARPPPAAPAAPAAAAQAALGSGADAGDGGGGDGSGGGSGAYEPLSAAVAKAYPGRASAAPLVDLLITLLHWGADGWLAALAAREALYGHLKAGLERAAAEVGERLLATPLNPISLGVTLDGLVRAAAAANAASEAAAAEAGSLRSREAEAQQGTDGGGGGGGGGGAGRSRAPLDVTLFGSMLWARGVSGTRVVAPGKRAVVAGLEVRMS